MLKLLIEFTLERSRFGSNITNKTMNKHNVTKKQRKNEKTQTNKTKYAWKLRFK